MLRSTAQRIARSPRRQYVNDILTSGPEAVAAAKRLIAEVTHKAPGQALEQTADAIARQRVSPEGQEGMRAFLDKRMPAWTDELG